MSTMFNIICPRDTEPDENKTWMPNLFKLTCDINHFEVIPKRKEPFGIHIYTCHLGTKQGFLVNACELKLNLL